MTVERSVSLCPFIPNLRESSRSSLPPPRKIFSREKFFFRSRNTLGFSSLVGEMKMFSDSYV